MQDKSFLDIKLQSHTQDECFRKVLHFLKHKKYHYQISLNVAKLVKAQHDKKLLTCINSADIINADGMPIKIIADILYGRKTARMGGLDYIEELGFHYPNLRYFFLGAEDAVVSKVVTQLQELYGLNVVGWKNGFFRKEETQHVVQEINAKAPDVLFVALGTPEKEYFLYDYKDTLQCNFAVGVGGAFDIIAGKQKRAPKWIQMLGMEWFFRFIQHPRKMWKRYLTTNSIFVYYLFRELCKYLCNKICQIFRFNTTKKSK